MTSEIIITTLMGLVLVAYGWIFKTVIDRIKRTEISHSEFENQTRKDIDEIKDNSSTVLTEVKTKLASIETNICWIKKELLKK